MALDHLWRLSSELCSRRRRLIHFLARRVPVIVFGASVGRGEFSGPATPADLVPTLAALGGVRIEKTDGQPLQDVVGVAAMR